MCLQPLKIHWIVHFLSLRVTTTGVWRMVLWNLDTPDLCPRTLVGSPVRSLLLCQSQPPERDPSLCTSSRKVLTGALCVQCLVRIIRNYQNEKIHHNLCFLIRRHSSEINLFLLEVHQLAAERDPKIQTKLQKMANKQVIWIVFMLNWGTQRNLLKSIEKGYLKL